MGPQTGQFLQDNTCLPNNDGDSIEIKDPHGLK